MQFSAIVTASSEMIGAEGSLDICSGPQLIVGASIAKNELAVVEFRNARELIKLRWESKKETGPPFPNNIPLGT